MSKFGERVSMLRNSMGLSLRELSKKTGISPSAIHAYETGKRKPKREALEAISDVFNVDIEYLQGKTDVRNSVAAALGVESLEEYYKKMRPREELTEGEATILSAYRALPDATQEKLTRLLLKFQALDEKDQAHFLDVLGLMLSRNQ